MPKKSINIDKINAHKKKSLPAIKKTSAISINEVDEAIAQIHNDVKKDNVEQQSEVQNTKVGSSEKEPEKKPDFSPRKRYVQTVLDDDTYIKLNEAVVREGFKSTKSFTNYAIAFLLKEKGYIKRLGSPESYWLLFLKK